MSTHYMIHDEKGFELFPYVVVIRVETTICFINCHTVTFNLSSKSGPRLTHFQGEGREVTSDATC